VVESKGNAAERLLTLDRQKSPLAKPKTEFGKSRVAEKNRKLAPKHQGSFTGTFSEHDVWYVYTLVLRNAKDKVLTVKVGYCSAPETREAFYNKALAQEVTGMSWKLHGRQPTVSEEAARKIEQGILAHYASHKIESNDEILRDVDPDLVFAKIGSIMR